jgi:hypothetical protein
MENNKIALSSGLSALLVSLVFAAGLLGQPNIYYGINETDITCNPIQCEKLSSVNSEGKQTRCYFFSEEKNRTTYKTCFDGWIKYKGTNLNDTYQSGTPENDTISEIYLLCEQTGKLIKECKVINSNDMIYKVD